MLQLTLQPMSLPHWMEGAPLWLEVHRVTKQTPPGREWNVRIPLGGEAQLP
jgi:hypothetical protein